MTRSGGASSGIYRQRGFWLRCFLECAVLAIAVGLAMARPVQGQQLEKPEPIQLWRLHGVFVNPEGNPLENVEVTLMKDGAVAYRTKTDGSGRFAFDHIYGRYWLHIDKAQYSPLNREVSIAMRIQNRLMPKTVYVIAGPQACADDCSSVFTSKSEFERKIKRNTEHYYQER